VSAWPVLLFADRLPPLIGGVEVHAGAFIAHFEKHERFPLCGIVTKSTDGRDVLLRGRDPVGLDEMRLLQDLRPRIVFFNSGRWIEDLPRLRHAFADALFVYRTGGNEILKAPLQGLVIPNHAARQAWWVRTLNDTVDLLITNSAYTERRLAAIGLATERFARCVGGVDASRLQRPRAHPSPRTSMFTAARFVPYKGHSLLVTVIHHLVSRGRDLGVRMAGDGPLLGEIRDQIARLSLSHCVDLIGARSNEDVCDEIRSADFYIQLSQDYPTLVPGGSYIHSEGMGRALLEACSAGTYIIATNAGAIREVVTATRGLLIETSDASSVADAIDCLLRHPPPRPLSTDEYDWDHVFRRYEELWETLLATFDRY
jgi:glycosyltransferase involved in cell wall biosynthesis